jgi:IS66 Orf2 like protein
MGLPSLAVLDGAGPRIWLAAEATDMRCGFDRLAARVQAVTGESPLSGHWFLFRSRCGSRLKILVWDRDGFAKPTKENPQSRVYPSAAPLPLASLVRPRLAHTQSRRSERLDGLLLQAS